MKKHPVSVVSVCAGIGGFDLGFERAGMETRAVVEIDADCRGVLARRFPRAAQFEDLASVRGAELPACDVLAGGTPCQGFSFAGLRGGLADDRSNLALQFCRLADELDPALIIWENVPGVLSMEDNAFGCFLAALVGADSPLRPPHQHGTSWTSAGLVIGPRRAAAWRILDAQYFGVAQRRRRVFVVASSTPELRAEILFERAGVRGDLETGREAREDIAACLTSGLARGGYDDRGDSGVMPIVCGTLGASFSRRGYDDRGDAGGVLPVVGALTTNTRGYTPECAAAGHYIAGTVCSKWAKGVGGPSGDECQNLAVVPPAEPIVLAGRARGDDGRGYAREEQVTAEKVGALNTVKNDRVLAPCAFKPSHFTRGKDGAPSELVPPLSADADRGDQEPLIFQPRIARNGRGRPESICPTLNGADAGATSDMRPCVAFPAGLSGTQCASSKELAPALQAENPTAVAAQVVRRLTPIECERLQGFPDNWTEGQADTPRYKQLGNAVNVAVSEWLGKRIVCAMKGPARKARCAK